ncbi:MAG TPA: VWA domain-containing protein [Candidatus Binataceae bacterium]|nr:VWA domain-containing protein [Candidatus Binataceae bacterium]
MFERPVVLWLLLAAPLVAAPGLIALRGGRRLGGALSTIIRIAVFAALVLMLAGLRVPIKAPARHLSVIVALDQSASIAPDQRAWMIRQVAAIRQAMDHRDQMAVIGFGRDAQLLAPLNDPRLLKLGAATVDSSATDIASALTTADGVFAEGDEKRLVLLSDGVETTASALDEVPALNQDGVRVFAATPPPSADARVALADFAAPAMVHASSSFALRLDIESESAHPVDAHIRLLADGAVLGGQQVALRPGLNRFELPYRIDRPGAYQLRAEVSVAPPLVGVDQSAETSITVAPPPRVLLISSKPPESLGKALTLRGYDIATAAPRGLPGNPLAYLQYQAVIVANVANSALAPAVQEALNAYVGVYGGGLIVTGDSLRDDQFHGGALERTLPINFVPQPPPPTREPVAVYLLIDRSNSMSYNSRFPAVRDGERIRYAKQAAIALLNQLDDTDYAGVIAFDSEPYVLGHMRPLGEDREDLVNRVARLEPGGGTDFKDALETAEREILATGLPVREVILLTDGDTNRQYHDHDELMADYAKEGIPVSTIRIGPDLDNLRLLQDFASSTGGIFYRVEDITKLPQLLVHLTHEAQNFKRHEHSSVDLGTHSSILNGIGPAELPPIDFFAATALKDDAEVPLTIHNPARTTPLLATWQYALGRSAVFVADPDSIGAIAWIRWDRYAEFWSQLVSWVARTGDAGPFTLAASQAADGSLTIEADAADSFPVNNLFARIGGHGHAVDVAMTQVGTTLYRGESAPLPRGKYSVVLMVKAGDTERVILEHRIAVPGLESPQAAELRIRPPNVALLSAIANDTGGAFDAPIARMLRRTGTAIVTYRSINSTLLPIVILLILGETLVRRRMLGD